MINECQWREAREAFARWAEDCLFQEAHRTGTTLLGEAVDIHLIDLYRELDFHSLLAKHPIASEVSDSLRFSESAYVALDAMLHRLSRRHSFVKSNTVDGVRHYYPVAVPEDRRDKLSQIYELMSALGDDYVAPLEFLAFGRQHFVRSLRDDHEFMDRVLTGQESEYAETWHRATNTDPLQDIHGAMGAKAVELLFEGGKILEVGGGTGNGIRNNLVALAKAEKLETLESYVFTDVSMPFIVNTRRDLRGKFGEVKCEWRLLNINKDFVDQRIEKASFDMIYGVNAAHIAKHTVEYMRQCAQALKPGGLMVYAERLRNEFLEMAPREIVLNLSSYHRTAAQPHPEYRPTHAYLSRKHWLRACELAGFARYEVWPSTDELDQYFPNQYAAVVVAQAHA